MEASVAASLASHAPDGPLLAAVSGGMDSMVLAHVLLAMRRSFVVAHFDHLTREGGSTADALFVERFACEHGLPCAVKASPVAFHARQKHASFEEQARDERYAFLHEMAIRHGCSAVVTAHHADDHAETVLLRLLRGCSPGGLRGIPPARRLRAASGLPLVTLARPLLVCRRADIAAYTLAKRIAYRTDASNQDRRHMRNRVRRELLPLLARDYNPAITDALTRLATLAHDEDALLAQLTQDFIASCAAPGPAIRRETFRRGHPALQRRAVVIWACAGGAQPGQGWIEGARDFICDAPSGRTYDRGGPVIVENGKLLSCFPRRVKNSPAPHPAVLAVPGMTAFDGLLFTARLLSGLPEEPLDAYCGPARQVFDARRLGKAVHLRLPITGDRFQPLGMSGHREVKDFLAGLGIPSSLRPRQPLVVVEGTIAWIPGHAVSGAFAVTDNTNTIAQIEVHDDRTPSWTHSTDT